MKYQNWTKENIKTEEDYYGKCKERCIDMLKEFPELKMVRGHYDCPIWGRREHWWMLDQNNKIIDPTAKQFPSGGIVEFYHEWDESKKEPTGKCLQCGGYCYNNESTCSEKCYREYLAYCISIY